MLRPDAVLRADLLRDLRAPAHPPVPHPVPAARAARCARNPRAHVAQAGAQRYEPAALRQTQATVVQRDTSIYVAAGSAVKLSAERHIARSFALSAPLCYLVL